MVGSAATDHANSAADRLGKVVKHIHCRAEPVHEPIIAGGLVRIGDLLPKRAEDIIRRIAGFEPAKEWV